MTIDEAIEHAEEKACGNGQCAKDHAQLVDWLRELRRARMEIDLLKTLRDGFKADAQKYKADNEKLRALVRDIWHAAGDCEECGHYDSCSGYPCVFHEQMRDLGIEVDG